MVAFLPLYIMALFVTGCCVSALPNRAQQDPGVLENIEEKIVPCPSGWEDFEDYCYLVSSSFKSWSEALSYCRALGGELVKINSEEENEFVLNLVRNQAASVKQVWIGMSWDSTGQDYFWSDGSVPVYENWANGEPNGFSFEPCTQMYTARANSLNLPNRASGRWNDIPCSADSKYPSGIVCKKLA